MLHLNLFSMSPDSRVVSIQWLSKLYVGLFAFALFSIVCFYQYYQDQSRRLGKQVISQSPRIETKSSQENSYIENQREQRSFFDVLQKLSRSDGVSISSIIFMNKEVQLQGTVYAKYQVEELMRQLATLKNIGFVKLVAMNNVSQFVEFKLDLSESVNE